MSHSWLESRFDMATIRLGRAEVRIEPPRNRNRELALIEAVRLIEGSVEIPWQASLHAFERLLDRKPDLPRQIKLVVSNEFVRYVLAPWTPEPLTEKEREQLVRALLAQRYGEREANWRIAIEPQEFEKSSLAAAIDADLVTAVQSLAARHDVRLTSMVPALVQSLNANRSRIGKARAGWLIDASDERLASIAFAGGAWTQVANERSGGLSSTLPEILLPMLRRDAIRLAELVGGTVFIAHGKGLSGVIDQIWPVVRLDGPELQP